MSRARLLKHLDKIYPLRFAESWDNVGLLVDSPSISQNLKILLTIDLTKSVVQEAISQNYNFIIAYHPFIFSGIKKINQSNPQHESLIKLIQNNISVYSPHTSIDAIKGGVNDWLVEGVSKNNENVKILDEVEEGVGCGRLVTLSESIKLNELINKIKIHLNVDNLLLSTNNQNKEIKTIAICAGSGSSVFKGVDADLYFTGELSHHEVLYYKESDKAVICANHSNTERGYLQIVKNDLEKEGFQVSVSVEDKDPFQFV
ncbi:hypothetical protein WICMUC_000393 [Wickerhamomyces mucosus]|uniref:Uncharacterized protein n=1 Tax=Wickerhamomyces mucosus TaxID=1378264 RepID=A0A9P8TIR4_9ASCO|nr:hypothetical protein WICMUC_000393 [Wickerhamomyces mucosus]